jgi:hypothetical protein
MHEYVNRLPGLRVAILATDGFEETELLEPRQALNAAGAVTVLIAPKSGQLHAMKHDPKTGTVNVDLTFDHANPADFDAALLPGGALNADSLRMNPSAQYFIRRMDAERKPIAVISRFVASDLCRADARADPYEFLRNSGRYSQRPSDLAGPGSRPLRKLGEQPPAGGYPRVQTKNAIRFWRGEVAG